MCAYDKNSLRYFIPIHFSTRSRNEYNIILASPKIQIFSIPYMH